MKSPKTTSLPSTAKTLAVAGSKTILSSGIYNLGMFEGYGVIVLNPNENYIEVEKTKAQIQLSADISDEPAEKRERKDKIQKETKKRRDFYEKYRNPQKEKETTQIYIRDNGSPEEHAIYVWDHFISQSAAENVFFVAHSYGGLAFVELLSLLSFLEKYLFTRKRQMRNEDRQEKLMEEAVPIFPLTDPETVSSRSASCCLEKETNPQLPTATLQEAVGSDKVTSESPFLRAKQPQLPQSFFIWLVLQVLQQPRCPPLDTLKHLNVLPKLRGPELDTTLKVWPDQCRVQGKNDLPAPSGHTIPDPGQDAIGPLGHLGTLLAHVQLLSPVTPGPFPPGHCPASHTFPSL
ncbi:hypothetical protein DUI87_04868 [Hirundo rustica rustica]|uniref:Arb2 domain-containing protein n=1 Tax=Hirundo rustica rustica TaxID=333673 RepID=A0A3M0KXH7_HIRRU|nr:hypothetical protein DUI87_04868 [Hirundo rustica rustica]